jgi:glycosyltransferase involved in cell wall biosynthesis
MENHNQPLISVIAAVLNNEKTIQRFIDSVTQQTYPNIELIIMDGGSTDGTVDILRRNTNRITYWESKKDKGIYDAWNKALEHVTGEWIIFLGADDYLRDSNVFEKIVPYLPVNHNRSIIVYAQAVVVNEKGDELEVIGRPWNQIKHIFPQIMGIPPPATLYNRQYFDAHGKFDSSFRIAGDYEMLLRELKTSDAIFIQNIILTAMQHGGISSNPENFIISLKEMRVAQKKHGYKMPGIYWIISYAKVRLRFLLWKLLGKNFTAQVLDWGRHITGKNPFWTRI